MKCMLLAASVLTGVGVLAAAPGVQSHGGHLHSKLVQMVHGGGEHGDGEHGAELDVATHLDQMAETLDLTAAQRKEVAGVLRSHFSTLHPVVQALLEAHGAQFAAMHAEFDEEAIRATSAPVSAAQEELAVAIGELLRDLHAVFTPAQLAKLKDLHPAGAANGVTAHLHEFAMQVLGWADRQ